MWQPSNPVFANGLPLNRAKAWLHLFSATWIAGEGDPENLDEAVLRDQFALTMFVRHGHEAPEAVAQRVAPDAGDWATRLYPARAALEPEGVPF